MTDRFPSTRRSLLLAMHQAELRDEALAAIVEIYWKPTYKYIRMKWHKRDEEARDHTQDFFASLIERELLLQWDPARAAFRTYLRLCIDGAIKNDLTARTRQKRNAKLESLDFSAAERELALADSNGTPEDIFHREWQRRLFELAITDLRRECDAGDKQVRFRIFEQYDLTTDLRPDYAALAAEHDVAVTTVTNHLAWARREIRRLVKERLARTTASDEELRSECRLAFEPK